MTNNGFAGHYRPDLMPGGSKSRPDVDTSSPIGQRSGLGATEARYAHIRNNATLLATDSQAKAFKDVDVPYMMRVARAASRWAAAQTMNGEAARRAADELYAVVNSR